MQFKSLTTLTRLALLVSGSTLLMPVLAHADTPFIPLTYQDAAFPMTDAPYLAAYRWGAANKTGGAKANEAFAKWLDRPVVWAEDFEPTEQWDNNIEGGGWQLGEWSDWKKAVKGRRLVLSVPLLPGGWDRSGAKGGAGAGEKVSYEAGARGDYNDHFKHLAENLVKYGLDDSILRLGWEFNGGWYTWRASDNPKQWAAYWQQIVKTMRAVPGAEKLKFCWNPATGWLQFPADQAWPGDEYVDLVGLDNYDQSWGTYPPPANATPEEIEARRRKTWDEVTFNGQFGLKFWRDFAIQHGKPFCLPEWGSHQDNDKHGGGDNVYYMEQMQKFIADPANHVYFACYFDVNAGDGHHQLSPGINGDEKTEFPLASARFKALFANPGNTGNHSTSEKVERLK